MLRAFHNKVCAIRPSQVPSIITDVIKRGVGACDKVCCPIAFKTIAGPRAADENIDDGVSVLRIKFFGVKFERGIFPSGRRVVQLLQHQNVYRQNCQDGNNKNRKGNFHGLILFRRTTSPRLRPVIRFHSRCVPIFLPGGQLAAHFSGLAERQRRDLFLARMPGQLLNDFQYRRLRGRWKRLRLVKDFFSCAHGGNLNQSYPVGKIRLWLDSQLSDLNLGYDICGLLLPYLRRFLWIHLVSCSSGSSFMRS